VGVDGHDPPIAWMVPRRDATRLGDALSIALGR
jgi:hypothetical protein